MKKDATGNSGTTDCSAGRIASAYQSIEFRLSKGRTVQVTLMEDENEVSVVLVGPKCGEMLVLPSAGNAIRVRANGPQGPHNG